MSRFIILAIVAALVGACDSSNSNHSSSGADPQTIDAGALQLVINASPWGMQFEDADGNVVLMESAKSGTGRVGALGIFPGPPAPGSGGRAALEPLDMGEPQLPPNRADGWIRATELQSAQMEGDVWVGTVATTDPDWTLEVRAHAEGEGIIAVSMHAIGGEIQATSVAFATSDSERFLGFGERGNAVNQAGNILENYVAEGPYQDTEYALINILVPKPGVRWRPDTTYYPIPWLLSSRGYGVLLDNDELSYHSLGGATESDWSMEAETSELRFRVFAGPKPADALERFTEAVGRQPNDYAPWFFGPWVQADNDARITELREADVPTSVAATYTHYLPCGSQRGNEDGQIARTAALNAAGTAVHTYFNPMICTDFVPEFDNAADQGALITTTSGDIYTYDYQTSSTFTVSQFDFSTPAGIAAYKSLTDEAIAHGYEGWMEDFGEYTPLDALAADGTTGTEFHNRYARDYHCGVAEATADVGKPLARFARSGWTGSAACSPIVWGGDPTVSFGFDGLESSVYQALSMGTSGVGLWGSDIGGFFAFLPNYLSPDLFDRWIQFGALSVIMRSQKDGIDLSSKHRPQPWEPAHIGQWRRYSKLHTQLYPYLQATVEHYYATGMPVMRHHLLTDPDDARAHGRDDQYLFGPDLLVAPVLTPDTTQRTLYLPKGHWVQWWRSVDYDEITGGFSLTNARIHSGEVELTVDAPPEEIPLFVRAGAVIPMLAPDVYTLADYGSDNPNIVRLDDRDDQLYLLAFPRGETSGEYFAGSSYTSVESADSWVLSLSDEVPREVHLETTLDTLMRPFAPCSVSVGGNALAPSAWQFDTNSGVLSTRFNSAAGELEVRGC